MDGTSTCSNESARNFALAAEKCKVGGLRSRLTHRKHRGFRCAFGAKTRICWAYD